MNGFNGGTNAAANMAAINAGLAAGAAARSAEEDKQRRLSHMGHDQVLIETKMTGEAIGDAISKLWSNWYYKDGKLYKKRGKIPFDFGIFGLMSVLIGILLFAIFVIGDMTRWIESFPLDMGGGLILSIVLGGVCGVLAGITDKEIDYIRITPKRDTTLVLIKLYDSSGYRNMDDDQVLELSEQINPVNKLKKWSDME